MTANFYLVKLEIFEQKYTIFIGKINQRKSHLSVVFIQELFSESLELYFCSCHIKYQKFVVLSWNVDIYL